MLVGHPQRRVGDVGRVAGEHLEQHDAERVNIAAPVEARVAAGLLGTHVVGRADGHGRARERHPGFVDLHDAEVRDVRLIVLVEQDVGRFEIAVDDAFGVGGVEAGGEARDDAGGLGHGQRPLHDPIGERAAGHVAHHKEGLSVFLAVVVHRDDGGVLERGDGLGLALEAGAERAVVQELARQHFDRYVALEARIVPAQDRRHAAFGDLRFDFVAPDGLGYHTHHDSSAKAESRQ